MHSSTPSAAQAGFSTPKWVQDAVFYQIFPDRFAKSMVVQKPANLEPWDSPPTYLGFKGGDLVGVKEHLDYLQDLGITAIYFCPVFQSTANHRYHTHDYHVIDPILGGDAALNGLLKEAHDRGIRIVIDGVFNHASRGFFQFNSILENGGESPYIDWFHVYSWPLHPYGPGDAPPNYACWWNLPALPKFNTNNHEVREFLWSVGEHWIKQGVDGWRLDVPNEIDDDSFWREFRNRVKGANSDAYIVGEIWGDARRWLQGDQFDAVMNYMFTRACLGFFASTGSGLETSEIEGTGLFPVPQLNAHDFRQAIDQLLQLYPWSATLAQLNLLGSHDTPRYLTMARNDITSVKLSTFFQMTFPGAPCIYYGDEIGLTGGHDPGCRGSFPWDHALWNKDLRAYVKKAVELRHAYPVFRRGEYSSLLSEDDVYAYSRTLENQIAVLAINCSHTSRKICVPLPDGVTVKDMKRIWEGDSPEVRTSCLDDWKLPGRSASAVMLQVEQR